MPDTVKLLTFDVATGATRMAREGDDALLYGLDDMQFMRIIRKSAEYPTPPEVVVDPDTNLPLRPLYLNGATGKAVRAVPISWTEGRPYQV